ncbi:MAG TPA: SCO family protein [Lysobacter sp.]
MRRFRILLFAILAGTALTLLSAAVLAGSAPKGPPLPGDSVYQLPLVLTDQSGQARDWRTRRGQPQVVSMFYTSCQYICPLIVDSGKAVDRSLAPAQRARLGILLISMDPVHDTPKALQYIVDKRQLDTQRWTLASPPAGDVRAVAGVLGIRYRQLADGNFNHTSALILLDAEGRILARTEQVGSRPDPEFLAAVRKATGP